jgi:hypothetical protein
MTTSSMIASLTPALLKDKSWILHHGWENVRKLPCKCNIQLVSTISIRQNVSTMCDRTHTTPSAIRRETSVSTVASQMLTIKAHNDRLKVAEFDADVQDSRREVSVTASA